MGVNLGEPTSSKSSLNCFQDDDIEAKWHDFTAEHSLSRTRSSCKHTQTYLAWTGGFLRASSGTVFKVLKLEEEIMSGTGRTQSTSHADLVVCANVGVSAFGLQSLATSFLWP